jgi:hypothetical protein
MGGRLMVRAGAEEGPRMAADGWEPGPCAWPEDRRCSLHWARASVGHPPTRGWVGAEVCSCAGVNTTHSGVAPVLQVRRRGGVEGHGDFSPNFPHSGRARGGQNGHLQREDPGAAFAQSRFVIRRRWLVLRGEPRSSRLCAVGRAHVPRMCPSSAESGGTRWDRVGRGGMTNLSKIKGMVGNGASCLGFSILPCWVRIPPWATRKSLRVQCSCVRLAARGGLSSEQCATE